MSNDDMAVQIAVQKQKIEDIERRVASLEANQRWTVLTIIGLVILALFEFVKSGSPL